MRVMVIGASRDSTKYGHRAVKAYLREGHEVFPVNPNADEIEGLTCYRSVADVPGPVDRASLYLPPDRGLEAVEALAERGDVEELWVNPGAESDELIARARQLGFEPVQACSITAIGQAP